MKKIFILLLLSLFLSGCATCSLKNISENSYCSNGYYYIYKNYAINIVSEPSGARIEINGNYIGNTPLTYYAEGNGYMNIIAYPSLSYRGYVQTKKISQYELLPRNIYFNMTLHYVSPNATPIIKFSGHSGCCSHHGGVCGCSCCDGTPLSYKCLPYYPECQ